MYEDRLFLGDKLEYNYTQVQIVEFEPIRASIWSAGAYDQQSAVLQPLTYNGLYISFLQYKSCHAVLYTRSCEKRLLPVEMQTCIVPRISS